jgi:hypothetical protein
MRSGWSKGTRVSKSINASMLTWGCWKAKPQLPSRDTLIDMVQPIQHRS